jgi:YbgC/YbaW family acyl-CoA thioester hydrolase
MTDSAPTPPAPRFLHRVSVRFQDIDLGGHAHHSKALVYLEEARWAYWGAVTGAEGAAAVNYILAEATVRYHQRVLYPGTLEVGVQVVALGRKHFDMEYEVRNPAGERVISGHTVQVLYDYEKGTSMSVSEALRGRIEAFEGRELPRRRGRP